MTNVISYGLSLAKTVHFPVTIVPRAGEIYRTLPDELNEICDEVNSNRQTSFAANIFSAYSLYYFCQASIPHKNRRPSSLSMAVVAKLSEHQKAQCNDTASIISSIHSRKSTRRRLNMGQVNAIQLSGTTSHSTTSSIAEDQQKIDRILFNLYADMASAYRSQTPANKEMSILNCLEHFVATQPQCLIAAIIELLDTNPATMHQSQSTIHNDNRQTEATIGRRQELQGRPDDMTVDDLVQPSSSCVDQIAGSSTDNLSNLSFHSLRRRLGCDLAITESASIVQMLTPKQEVKSPTNVNYFITNRIPPSHVQNEPAISLDFEEFNLNNGQDVIEICATPMQAEAISPLPPTTRRFDFANNSWEDIVCDPNADLFDVGTQLSNVMCSFDADNLQQPPFLSPCSNPNNVFDFEMNQRTIGTNSTQTFRFNDDNVSQSVSGIDVQSEQKLLASQGRLSLTPLQRDPFTQLHKSDASTSSRFNGKSRTKA